MQELAQVAHVPSCTAAGTPAKPGCMGGMQTMLPARAAHLAQHDEDRDGGDVECQGELQQDLRAGVRRTGVSVQQVQVCSHPGIHGLPKHPLLI